MSARSRFLEPPRLGTTARDAEDDRRATWLELFFDLVFVAAVGSSPTRSAPRRVVTLVLALVLIPLDLSPPWEL